MAAAARHDARPETEGRGVDHQVAMVAWAGNEAGRAAAARGR